MAKSGDFEVADGISHLLGEAAISEYILYIKD